MSIMDKHAIFEKSPTLLLVSSLLVVTVGGIVEIAPLAYMRGRTLNRACVILDEAQNATREQMLMFLTR